MLKERRPTIKAQREFATLYTTTPAREVPFSKDSRERLTFTEAEPKLARHPERVKSLLAENGTIPISMEVDLSYFCGDKCDFCHFAFTHKNSLGKDAPRESMEKIYLLPELADRILGGMASAGVRSVVFSGGGEPLDNRHALEIFKLAKKHSLEMGMYTRGQGLRREVAEFVSEHFSWVVVSLDATNIQDHYALKGTKSLGTKVQNILDFVAKENRKANISVSAMVGPQHLEQVAPYPEQRELLGEDIQTITRLERDMFWFLGLGVDEVQIRPIVDTGNYAEQREARKMFGLAYKTDEEGWRQHYSWIPKMLPILENYKDVPGLNTSIDKFENLYEGTSGFDTCDGMLVSAGLVGTDGTVYKCVNLRKITAIGNLKDQTMEELFLDPNLDRKVDENCRVGCRGCKVNKTLHRLRETGEALPALQNPKVKHPNFI